MAHIRIPLFIALLFLGTAVKTVGQTNKPLQAASAVGAQPTTTDVTVRINQSYTSHQAIEANLDWKNPQLSTDGFLSSPGDGTPKNPALASSECLLAETLLIGTDANPGFTDDTAATFCKSLFATSASANNVLARRYESSLSQANVQPPKIDYALIHIVSWKKTVQPAGEPAPTGTWYLFSRNGGLAPGSIVPWTNVSGVSAIAATTHLLGDNNVAFLAIHLGIDATCGISYDIKATHTTPLNRQDLSSLIQTAISIYGTNASGSSKAASAAASNAKKLASKKPQAVPPPPPPLPVEAIVGLWGGEVILKQPVLPASIAVAPSISGTIRAYSDDASGKEVRIGTNETIQANLDDSIVATCSPVPKKVAPATASIRRLSDSDEPANQQLHLASYVAADQFQGSKQNEEDLEVGDPSSPTTPPAPTNANAGATAKDPLAGLSQTIPNEGTHHWDVSIAMPVTSYKSLKYDSTNNLVVPKATSSVTPYALIDFYPDAVDLAAYRASGIAISMPKITAGIPMGSQPLQNPFVGLGFIGTIKSFHFQPIIGLHIRKEVRADSPSSTLTHTEWHAKLQIMIGFSITDARKVLGLK